MTPVTATKLATLDELWESVIPGSFTITDKLDGAASFVYLCPCGCGQHINLPIHTGPKREQFWAWDGNEDTPTLTPSINRLDGCRFHGYITAGVWTSL